jgi:hypothetical protein
MRATGIMIAEWMEQCNSLFQAGEPKIIQQQ